MTKPYIMRKKEVHDFMRDLGKLECREIKIHGCSVVEITLSEEAQRAVAVKAEKVFNACKGKWSSIENLKIGLSGQAATTYQLSGDWREGVNQMREGVPDEYDIKFKGFKIDVKTFQWLRSDDPDTWMVVNWWKFHDPHRSFPYYIGCMMRSDYIVQILGFMSHETLERVGVKVNYHKTRDPDEALIGVKSITSFAHTHIKKLSETLEKEKSRRAQTTLKFNS